MTSQASGDAATTLARNIRLARDEAKFTQRVLAERLGVDTMMVSKWERGRHRPSHENLIALARELGRDLPWMYTDHDGSAVAA